VSEVALVPREAWGGAAERGLQARNERSEIIKRVLVKGTDFGVIPGTKQETLLKAGAEKIVDSLNLYPDYEPLKSVEDFEKPLFYYQYRCVLRARGIDSKVATGIGSCNSMESRYRWRNSSRVCPRCGQETIIKGKEEYGGGWLCFAKKGGCGAKFDGDDVAITSQKTGQIPNEDVYSLVNTIDKMAQKRALVAATLNLGFSDKFTQDVEDNPSVFGAHTTEESEDPAPREIRVETRPQPSRGAAPPLPPVTPTWRGKLVKMTQHSGEKNGRPWTRSEFSAADGTVFKTFDTSHAADLLALEGHELEITYSYGKGGGWMIEEWKDLTLQDAPFAP
jgi:hypothetical protein